MIDPLYQFGVVQGDCGPTANWKRAVVGGDGRSRVPSNPSIALIEVQVPSHVEAAEELPKQTPAPVLAIQIGISVGDE